MITKSIINSIVLMTVQTNVLMLYIVNLYIYYISTI